MRYKSLKPVKETPNRGVYEYKKKSNDSPFQLNNKVLEELAHQSEF